MSYAIEIHPKCQDEIKKLCKKNNVLEKALKRKIKEILEVPNRYKPMKYDLAGEKRVHIMKSFVLRYEIDEKSRKVRFIFFGHHDDAYKW